MTCVIGYVSNVNSKTYLCSDSLATNETDRVVCKNEKLYTPSSNLGFGFAGSYRFFQVFKNRFPDYFMAGRNFEDMEKPEFDVLMQTDFVDFVREILEMEDMQMVDEYETAETGKRSARLSAGTYPLKKFPFEMMIAFKNSLYVVDSDFSILEPDMMFHSIGSGYKYSQPLVDYMYSEMCGMKDLSREDLDVEIKSRLYKVITTVSRYSNFVGGPARIIEVNHK